MNQSLEGCIQLTRSFLKLKDILLSPLCCLTSPPRFLSDPGQLCWACELTGTKHPSGSVQKPSWRLHSLNRAGRPCGSTWWCGSGRLAECRAQTVHTLTFIVEQWLQKLSLPPPTHLSVKRNPVVTWPLFDPYHDLGYLPEPSLLPLNKEKWSYVSS